MLLRQLLLGLCLLLLPATTLLAQGPQPGAIWVLDLDDAVGPATADYLVRGMEQANLGGAALVVIRINTPGGLDGAMRHIIEAILASPIPVASYVAPKGARAASAGTYILYASHIAAMASATNLGAATPVAIGAPGGMKPESAEEDEDADSNEGETAMGRKMINDAAAYIRGLAELRGRNESWAEQAVREASSLSANEALEQGVIDLVANDLRDLARQLQGREIVMDDQILVLDLENAAIHSLEADWRTEFLATITNPSLVLVLGMIGFYGIILEFYNPGSLVPGTVGIICLLLAGYALQLLPVNYAGLALLVVGIGLMVAEAMSPSFGILGAGGIVAFTMGGLLLFDSDVEAFQVGWPVLLSIGAVTAGFIIITVSIAVRMRKREVTTGIEQIVGCEGVVLADSDGHGQVRVSGEIWEAQSERPLLRGDRVVVTAVDGLLLSVEKEES